jgi:hypothetical protein
MSVQLLGEQWDQDGMALALSTHVEAHHKNSKELLNISDGLEDVKRGEKRRSQYAPRPAYVHQPYPKHLYHADGREQIVADEDAQDAAVAAGFRTEPYPKVRVALGDPGAEKAALQAKLLESDGKIASQNDLLQKLMTRLEALEKPKGKKGQAE